MSEINEKSCGAVVIKKENDQNYVLLIRHLQGHWGFPKGHVEPNETEWETAYREVYEETGLYIEQVNDFRDETHYSPRPGVMKDVVYFIASVKGGELIPQPEEVIEVKWVTFIDAISVLTFDNDTSLLKKAIKYYKELYEDSDD